MSEFFGELYLRSTLPFLSSEMTGREVGYLESALSSVSPAQWVVDLGCGHGRHASRLAARRKVLGVERDGYSLSQRQPGFTAIRGDFFRLPFRDASIGGAYAWYSTLFTFEDEQQLPLFREIARVLIPGGRLVLHTVPYDRASAQPNSHFEQTLEDGSFLEERCRFDPISGRDQASRRLALADGRELSASFFIRYYPLPQLSGLLDAAGFSVQWVHGGVDAAPLSSESTDLIVGADRNHV